MMIVYPSGAAWAARVVPVVPPAPVTFSTTTCWPSVRDLWSPTMRATTSVGPPAAKGTMRVMGRSGYAACAVPAESPSRAAKSNSRLVMGSLLGWWKASAASGGSFGEDLGALLAHRRKDRGRQHDQRGPEEARADGPLDEGREVAAGDEKGPAEVLLHQPAEHVTEQERSRLEAELEERVADQGEHAGQHHVGGRAVHRVDADAGEDEDGRVHQPVRHVEELHPDPDERQVDDEQHEVAHPHARDHSPEERRVLGHHQRPGHDAVDGHRADHQGHDRIGRDSEREERDEGALRACVVRRFRPGHALDGAPAEAARVLRQLLLQRVGGEGPQHRAVAGQDAEGSADQGPAHDRAGGALQSSRPGRSRPIGTFSMSRFSGTSRFFSTSANPITPIASTTKSMPLVSAESPNVRRSAPVSRSVPIVDRSSPSRIIASALGTEPRASTTAKARPRTISEKYSAGPKSRASFTSGAASAAMTIVETHPAKKEPMAAMPSATPARPCRAIWCPSRQVTMAVTSPGMLTRFAVVDPPYCAP